jgi:hypothetical protein
MQASKILTGLNNTIILREAVTGESFFYAKKIAKELKIRTSFPEKSGRKINNNHSGEESSIFSEEDCFRIQPKKIVDVVVADVSRKSEML